MTDMIAWLRAQLDEDERLANAATGLHWYSNGGWELRTAPSGEGGPNPRPESWAPFWFLIAKAGEQPRGAWDDFRHIERHEPAFVLADIAAKRAILDAYEEAKRYYEGPGRAAPAGEVHGLWTAIQHLAYAYRHRPGYLPEWAPEGQQG
jgi:hypothetical protein